MLVVGSVSGSPAQIGAIAVNVEVVGVFTLTIIVAFVAHCPAVGVKVYVVVAILLIAGDQFPVIPFVELVGNAGIVAPEQ